MLLFIGWVVLLLRENMFVDFSFFLDCTYLISIVPQLPNVWILSIAFRRKKNNLEEVAQLALSIGQGMTFVTHGGCCLLASLESFLMELAQREYHLQWARPFPMNHKLRKYPPGWPKPWYYAIIFSIEVPFPTISYTHICMPTYIYRVLLI